MRLWSIGHVSACCRPPTPLDISSDSLSPIAAPLALSLSHYKRSACETYLPLTPLLPSSNTAVGRPHTVEHEAVQLRLAAKKSVLRLRNT